MAFRRYTLLPLDDCLYALQPTIPNLARSSLHRCFQRHGIERLPDVGGNKGPKKQFKACPTGYFHIDIAEVGTAEGKLHLFVAIDKTSKYAYVELHQKATTAISKQFLDNLVIAVPCTIHTVLTDNGIQFTDPTGESWTPADIRKMRAEGKLFRCHAFESGCATHNIDHRLTKPKHPWTNGQVGRMNRTLKQATVHRCFHESHEQLRQHLAGFVNAHNFARRPKALKGPAPYEFICKSWTNQPERFNPNPIHQMPGLNS